MALKSKLKIVTYVAKINVLTGVNWGYFISSNLDPFLSAIWKGDAKALSAIIQTKPRNLLEANQEGWLPLHESAYYGHVDCLKILLSGKESFIDHLIPNSPVFPVGISIHGSI